MAVAAGDTAPTIVDAAYTGRLTWVPADLAMMTLIGMTKADGNGVYSVEITLDTDGVLDVCTTNIIRGISEPGRFDSSPGVVRRQTGDQADITWTLTDPYNPGDRFASLTIKKLSTGSAIIEHSGNTGVCTTHDSDVTCIIPDTPGTTVGFGITGITTSDADQYRCDVIHDTSSSAITNDDAYIYVYGQPTKPTIPIPPTVSEGDDVSLTCSSSSISIPSEHQLPLRYTWTRDGSNLTQTPVSRHTVSGNQLSITGVIRDDANHQYRCVAGEDGGPTSQSDPTTITVTFPSTVYSFRLSNTGEIVQGQHLDIICDVTARPSESDITITNIYTNTLIKEIQDSQSVTYTFSSVHVLNSGQHQCSATNGVGSAGTKDLTVDIKGGYAYCESPQTQDGAALNDNVTVSICLSANPFNDITSNHWQFVPRDITSINPLPTGVTTRTDGTSHQYKKYVRLVIPNVQETHYGMYTLTRNNGYNTVLMHTFRLVPQGPPMKPSNFIPSHEAAISITVQWMTGFNGGSPQTFTIKYTNTLSAVAREITGIPDSGSGGGDDLMSYEIREGIDPETEYQLEIWAVNIHGQTPSDPISATTPALATFSELPVITINRPVATIHFEISGPLTHIQVENCVKGTDTCRMDIVTVPQSRRRKRQTVNDKITFDEDVQLADPAANSFTFIFVLYDGDIALNDPIVVAPPGDGPPIGILVGVIAGVVVAGIIVAVIIVLWRKVSTTHKRETDIGLSVGMTNQVMVDPEGPYETMQQTAVNELQKIAASVYGSLTIELNIFPNSAISLGSLLNNGAFYDVYSGTLRTGDTLPLHVVIKKVAVESSVHRQFIMDQTRSIFNLRSHNNIIGCLGINEAKTQLVMENAALGNLQQYLQAVDGPMYDNVASMKSTQTEMNFINQIIEGVIAVHQLETSALFYCLSASQVLVTSQNQCKLSGFSTKESVIAREKYEEENQLPRPIRWLAPEAIELNHITQSDIWSLGVLIWEILNAGTLPLHQVNDVEVRQFIVGGQKPLKTPRCSDDIYHIMEKCWMYKPYNRPILKDVQLKCQEICQYEPI